jgi:hypothetical protein
MQRDGIEDEARVLREAVRGLGRQHPTAAVPRELRAKIVAFSRRAQTVGWGMERAARAVGVSAASIRNWRRDHAGAGALVPVAVVPSRSGADAGLQLVGPSGYRVQGLDVATTVALLRALE